VTPVQPKGRCCAEDERPVPSGFASPPCLAHELDPLYADPLAVDPQQALDVARWRKAERARLRAERMALPPARRRAIAAALAHALDALLADHVGPTAGLVVAGYWPIKGEPNLRGWLAQRHAAGAVTALPVVERRAAPLVFRRWQPGMRLVRGHWGIPVPPPEAGAVTPDILLAPLVGWDGDAYRLGFGGGYFDRTLAALAPRPLTIGVGLAAARRATIFPQPHDVPLDAIVTEEGVQVVRER
jgi:5,10-methenyltetrahydrofolate synthetase